MKKPKKQSAKSKGEERFAELCRLNGIPMPRRHWQFQFDRAWRTDFDWLEHGIPLVVEVEGMGRHITPGGFREDMDKYNRLVSCGIFLLRFLTADCMNGNAVRRTADVLRILASADYLPVREENAAQTEAPF